MVPFFCKQLAYVSKVSKLFMADAWVFHPETGAACGRE